MTKREFVKSLDELSNFYLRNKPTTRTITVGRKQWSFVETWKEDYEKNKTVPIEFVFGDPHYRGFRLEREA